MTGLEADCGSDRAPSPEEAEPPPALVLDLVRDGGDWNALSAFEPTLARLARAIADHPRSRTALPAVASVVLSSDATVRELNRTYRGQDTATNVLSFPLAPEPGDAQEAVYAGDVVLAEETVAREARELGVLLIEHVQHLVVHGVLHLFGLDHETDAEAVDMERTEAQVLAAVGLPDPYARAEEQRGAER